VNTTIMSPNAELTLQSMQEEHRHLRQELETNRRFVFERPLLIAGAGFAGFASFSANLDLRFIPIPLLAVLLFNLWFTFNRLCSNARIVAYIQLVHEPLSHRQWCGWETALRLYRAWFESHSSAWRHLEKKVVSQRDGMGFYAPIFWFHIALGVIVTVLVVSQLMDRDTVIANGFALLAYVAIAFRMPAARIRTQIAASTFVWDQVLQSKA
jgi:hypothetical protein